MANEEDRWIVLEDIVALNGGQLVGKTRLQKTLYILQAVGVKLGYEFDYHHYGPYSEQIVEDAKWAVFLGKMEESQNLGFHQVPYTVFKTSRNPPDSVFGTSAEKVRSVLGLLNEYSAVVLELAATHLYLEKSGFAENAEQELISRKSAKATSERLAKSRELLGKLGLRHNQFA